MVRGVCRERERSESCRGEPVVSGQHSSKRLYSREVLPGVSTLRASVQLFNTQHEEAGWREKLRLRRPVKCIWCNTLWVRKRESNIEFYQLVFT